MPGDLQTILNLGGGSALTVLGWFAREMWGAVTKLRGDLSALREEIAKGYVPKDDFRDAVDGLRQEMRENFTRLFDRLDRKQDKP
jgi:hypothetical protein